MKLITTHFPRQIFLGIKKLLPSSKTSAPNKFEAQAAELKNKFIAWPLAQKPSNQALGVDKNHDIDLRLLEQFLKSSWSKEVSYQGLISSHLQPDGEELPSPMRIQRMLAAQKMLKLISSTIAEIKMIELCHIANRKG